MANPKHLEILRQGVEVWNKKIDFWGFFDGHEKPDLSKWDGNFLREFSFPRFFKVGVEDGVYVGQDYAELHTQYEEGTFSYSQIAEGWKTLNGVNFRNTDLSGSDLHLVSLKNATFEKANLSFCNLESADLSGANFTGANLHGASLINADLSKSIFINTNLHKANLSGSNIYGISAWDVYVKGCIQNDLRIWRRGETSMTTDNFEIAQFLYLILTNENLRQVIDTITSKVVLILGSFAEERKIILDLLKQELRNRNYLPILFDFEKPNRRDLTETISTIAHMSKFIIADITEAKSIPQELLQIIPDLPSVPVQPVLLSSQKEYAMFEHFNRYPWVLKTYYYNDVSDLLNNLAVKIIEPAESKLSEIIK